jgi:hypothetical protein
VKLRLDTAVFAHFRDSMALFFHSSRIKRAKKAAVRAREEKLVSDLKEILGRLGYRLEPLDGNGVAGRPTRATGRGVVSAGPTPLTCSECGRTFALPLHLGRHMSTMHKGNSANPTTPTTSENGPPQTGPATKAPQRRRRMRPAARRAAARRMRAYWRKRKAAAGKTPPERGSGVKTR